MNRPHDIREILAQRGSVLAGLARRAERLQRLDSHLAGFLDRPLLDHVHVAAIDGTTLVLSADGPVWGHRVRYLAPAIVEHLRDGGETGLRDARVIVRPEDRARAQPIRPRPRLSRASASLLERIADSLDNPPLSRSLRRLGRRAR